jgi:hypothetical protein
MGLVGEDEDVRAPPWRTGILGAGLAFLPVAGLLQLLELLHRRQDRLCPWAR